MSKFAAALGATAVVSGGLVSMTMAPANAVAVNGGCASFFVDANTPIEGTGGASGGYLGQPKGAWSDEATTSVLPDYTLTSSGSDVVGQTRDFALTYDKGMKSFAPASGPQYWFFSVNGVMQPAITNQLSISSTTAPGATINGSFTIADAGTNTVTFEKMIFDATAGVRVVCSGQSGNTATLNSHTTPVATNVKNTFTAIGPTVATTSVKLAGAAPGNQTVSNYGRAGDIINVNTSVFATADPGTLQLCDADGTSNCEGAGTVTGNSTGTLTIPAGATTGARKLVATVGTEKARADFNVLGQAVVSVNQAVGPVGTTLTVTGNNFDPGVAVSVRGVTAVGQAAPTYSADPAVSVTASGTGTFSTSYTVNDAATIKVSGGQVHRIPAYATLGAVTGFADFEASANGCTAKVGSATTGSCTVVQTLSLDVTAGDLTMAQSAGEIAMSDIDLDGTDQVSTGAINDIVVKDYRNGTLGWTLNAVFSGMSGAGDIDASALSLVAPDCEAGTNNTNEITTAAAGAFVDDATAITLCAVDPADLDTANGETSSGDTTANSDLALDVASDTAPGNYVGTLTFTLQ